MLRGSNAWPWRISSACRSGRLSHAIAGAGWGAFRTPGALKALAILAAFSAVATADLFAGTMGFVETEPGSGITIEVKSVLENSLSTPATPLQITISNRSPATGSWNFRFDSSGSAQTTTVINMKVEAGQTRTFPVLVRSGRSGNYSSVQGRADGTGVIRARFGISSKSYSSDTEPWIIGDELAGRTIKPLEEKLKKPGRNLSVSEASARLLPGQWTGLAEIGKMVLTEREWSALPPEVRGAVRQWVGSGGELLVASKNSGTFSWRDFGLEEGSGPLRYGLGSVRSIPWDGKDVDPSLLAPLALKKWPRKSVESTWTLLREIGKLNINPTLIFFSVLAMAALLGPVNLFVLAPAGRRHRLFVTTPALSLGCSALLVVGILVKDGTGGRGERAVLLHLLPGSHEAIVIQEQASKTGLLLSKTFSLDPQTVIWEVPRDGRTEWNGGLQSGGSYSCVEGSRSEYSGDWFQSRSIKVHRLQAVTPTRAAVTVVGRDATGAPQVVSSFTQTLTDVVFKDGEDRWWRAPSLRTGEKTTLARETARECVAVASRASESFEANVRELIETAHGSGAGFGRANHFYGTLADAEGLAIPTLDSIRWRSRGMAIGEVEIAPEAREGGRP